MKQESPGFSRGECQLGCIPSLAYRAERDELRAKLDRIREAVDSMTGLPSVSKLAAFLETIKEIIKPKEG